MSDSGDSAWRAKTDDEMVEAAGALSEYTEEGEQIIRAELRRRGLPAPPPAIGKCARCGRSVHATDPGVECTQCLEPFPPEILSKLKPRTDEADEPASRDGGEADLVTVASFTTPGEASLARSALDAAGIPSVATSARLGGISQDRPWIELLVQERDREEAVGVLNDAGPQ